MWKVIVCVIFVIGFIGSAVYFTEKSTKRNLSYHFNGEVQNVRYNEKGQPYVTIGQKTYYLSYPGWNFGHKIQKGDSLEKKKNTLTVKLTKAKTGEVIIFDR